MKKETFEERKNKDNEGLENSLRIDGRSNFLFIRDVQLSFFLFSTSAFGGRFSSSVTHVTTIYAMLQKLPVRLWKLLIALLKADKTCVHVQFTIAIYEL